MNSRLIKDRTQDYTWSVVRDTMIKKMPKPPRFDAHINSFRRMRGTIDPLERLVAGESMLVVMELDK